MLSAPLAYGLAVAACAVALALNLLLQPMVGPNTFPLFLLAVMVATWLGGLGPGLLATGLGLALSLALIELLPLPRADGPGSTSVRALLFVGTAGCIVALASRLRAALRHAEAAREHAETAFIEAERRAAEARRAEERFRRLLELAPDGIVLVNQEGRIVLANTQAHASFRYDKDELLGMPIERLVPERLRDVHSAHRADYHRRPRTRPMGLGLDLVGRRKDGSEIPVEISLSPIETADGIQVLGVVRDISERKKVDAQVRALNVDLERRLGELAALNRELEAFSYSVSHDLRAPLRAIDGFSLALVEEAADRLDETGREYLQRIRAAAQRMGELIDDLLDLSRVTRREMRREPVDLSAMARAVLAQLERSDPERRVEAVVADGLAASGDPHLLRVALENLLGNAWKFSSKEPNPRIEVGAVPVDGGPAYYVRDNGVGFDMAYADKLFGAFQRLHAAGEFPGTGVGLATVQRIVLRHGGRIWAEAAPGRGATFYFTLPDEDRRCASTTA